MDLKNLLIDSKFTIPKRTWKVDRCQVTGATPLIVSSNKKVFGIHQSLFIRKPGRYYFRISIRPNIFIKECCIGVLEDGVLRATKYYVSANCWKKLSVIVDVKNTLDLISLYLIIIGVEDINNVEIKEPVLYRLDDYSMRFSLKFVLDRRLKYTPSFSYTNLLQATVFRKKEWVIEKDSNSFIHLVKSGAIVVETSSRVFIKQSINLLRNHKYLLKLMADSINNQGNINICYPNSVALDLGPSQIGITFTYNGEDNPYIEVKAKDNSVIPYIVSLKKALLIDITDLEITEEDAQALLYIK